MVEYIRHEQKEARVYHEKYIGSAICDVMVAAENVGLIGYEIKSDIAEGYMCPQCGNPCHCSCVVYIKF